MEIIKKGSDDVFATGPLTCCWPPGSEGNRDGRN
jgi:hypothetical protein